ncbi:MAG: GNAT family N-acetyltransferase [Acidimicrobiia bacterium]
MIRPATLEDAARLAEIHIASWQAAYRDLLPADFLAGLSDELEGRTAQWQDWLGIESEHRKVLVGVADEVVGFAHFGPSGDKDLKASQVGELYAMYVDPAYYRQGWGSQLMDAAFAEMRGSGFVEGSLWVMTANDAARSFYESHGWEPDGKSADQCLGITIPAVRYRAKVDQSA